MPRHQKLRGTSAYPRDFKVDLPYLEDFCSSVEPSDTVVSTKSLHDMYSQFVASETTNVCERRIAGSIKRFAIQFCKVARTHKYRASTTGQRGYFVAVRRSSRTRKTSSVPVHVDMGDSIDIIHISPLKGYGVFAKRDISAGEYVCRYKGQLIPECTATERETEYAEKDLPLTMVSIGNGQYLDGNRNEEGDIISVHESVGAALNHSFQSPNCQLKKHSVNGMPAFYIYSKTRISKGTELTWNYSYEGSGRPDWFKTS
jgi:hypothetical protein